MIFHCPSIIIFPVKIAIFRVILLDEFYRIHRLNPWKSQLVVVQAVFFTLDCPMISHRGPTPDMFGAASGGSGKFGCNPKVRSCCWDSGVMVRCGGSGVGSGMVPDSGEFGSGSGVRNRRFPGASDGFGGVRCGSTAGLKVDSHTFLLLSGMSPGFMLWIPEGLNQLRQVAPQAATWRGTLIRTMEIAGKMVRNWTSNQYSKCWNFRWRFFPSKAAVSGVPAALSPSLLP